MEGKDQFAAVIFILIIATALVIEIIIGAFISTASSRTILNVNYKWNGEEKKWKNQIEVKNYHYKDDKITFEYGGETYIVDYSDVVVIGSTNDFS